MDKRYEELLQHVQRPARYIGNEINAVIKDWRKTDLKIALVFPDIYEIGMSHLGIKILYHILNSQPNMLCERVFAPWIDMEKLLRDRKLPIVTLENKKPLKEFDIIGFSLLHELNYTNVLNILDMSGIPLRSKNRPDCRPLIIAGGPCAFNPEPLSEFIDLFLIGDGEKGILDIANCYLRCGKNGKMTKNRKAFLKEFSGLEGVYIPAFYEAEYKENVFKRLVPLDSEIPATVKKRIMPDLKSCFYPTRQVVSYIPLVHDRISLEIMRGCPHRCRFCQAAPIYSPTRTRSEESITNLARKTHRETGYDEISLLSLSTGDYPGIMNLLQIMIEEFKLKGVSISLPSLRVEKGIENFPPLVRKIKKTGFTFAPEVGSNKLRKFINKNIDNKKLTESVKNAYQLGWRKIKLYFMIGFAGEYNNDLDELLEMVADIASLGQKTGRKAPTVTLSISSFVPKPHTPFQWEGMEPAESLRRKIDYIRKNIKMPSIKLSIHNVNMSVLEGVMSRGDRRLCDVIETAFLNGARFDNWDDLLDISIWQASFSKCGIDFIDYLRRREYHEPLPWEHINPGVSKERLKQENICAHTEADIPIN